MDITEVTSERSLATLERVTTVTPIPGADAIETVTVRGWQVVVRKEDGFKVGDLVVYFEIDSALPLDDARFAFLTPRGEKAYEGRRVHVLRTVRLRGQVSQGLVLPLAQFDEDVTYQLVESADIASTDPDINLGPFVGTDISATLGVSRYEEPIPAEMEGRALGAFPTRLLAKTSAGRVQNLIDRFDEVAAYPNGWLATEKIDGTSVTLINDGTLRTCSRSWEMIWDESLPQVRIAVRNDLVPGPDEAVQAELYGPGIHRNQLRVDELRLAVFAVLRRQGGVYLPVPRSEWPQRYARHGVPVLDLVLPGTVEEALAQADVLRSAVNPVRRAEGIVWHTSDAQPVEALAGGRSFKAISNSYLVKTGS